VLFRQDSPHRGDPFGDSSAADGASCESLPRLGYEAAGHSRPRSGVPAGVQRQLLPGLLVGQLPPESKDSPRQTNSRDHGSSPAVFPPPSQRWWFLQPKVADMHRTVSSCSSTHTQELVQEASEFSKSASPKLSRGGRRPLPAMDGATARLSAGAGKAAEAPSLLATGVGVGSRTHADDLHEGVEAKGLRDEAMRPRVSRQTRSVEFRRRSSIASAAVVAQKWPMSSPPESRGRHTQRLRTVP